MSNISLSDDELALCDGIARGEEFDASGKKISAEVIRRLILRLPMSHDRLPQSDDTIDPVYPVPLGIRIKGGTITDSLDLSKARSGRGGAVPTLAFTGSTFEGRLSGAHTRFGTVSLIGCFFDDKHSDKDKEWVPTIDFSGAAFESDLVLRNIKPPEGTNLGLRDAQDYPVLWIRLVGARVAGSLDLSGCNLRAPKQNKDRQKVDSHIVPLNLSLIDVAGDLTMVSGFHCLGPVRGRSMSVRGDVSLTGSNIEWDEALEPNEEGASILFQLAKIGGNLHLNGGYRFPEKRTGFAPIEVDGVIDLSWSEVGGSVVLQDFVLSPRGKEDLCLRMTGARVGGRLDIGTLKGDEISKLRGRLRLDRVRIVSFLQINSIDLAWKPNAGTARPITHIIDARVSECGPVRINALQSKKSGARRHGITFTSATVRRVVASNLKINGQLCLSRLSVRGTVEISGRFQDLVDLERMTLTGSLELKDVSIQGEKSKLSLNRCVIGRTLQVEAPAEKRVHRSINRIATAIDLTGASCDVLDDNVGRAWGYPDHIDMNHFIYNRTAHPRADQDSTAPAMRRHPSYAFIWNPICVWKHDGVLPFRWLRKPKIDDYWENWQLRRNWINLQYELGELTMMGRRRKINADNYNPQPFHHAIKVARREGHEEAAAQIEMYMNKMEWRIFIKSVRAPLAVIGVIAAAVWLVYKGLTAHNSMIHDSTILTLSMLSICITIMILASAITDAIDKYVIKVLDLIESCIILLITLLTTVCAIVADDRHVSGVAVALLPLAFAAAQRIVLGKPKELTAQEARAGTPSDGRRRARRIVLFYAWVPALILLVQVWSPHPLPWFVGMLIFLTFRWIARASHLAVRVMFGYMRRPIRALGTIVTAFLLGWLGVLAANGQDILVVDTLAVAPSASVPPARNSATAEMGVPNASSLLRDLPCRDAINPPIYALDILIPLLDLKEEGRCKVKHPDNEPGTWEDVGTPGIRTLWWSLGKMIFALPEIVQRPTFWATAKTSYGIAGWLILSLAILTFAHSTRSRFNED